MVAQPNGQMLDLQGKSKRGDERSDYDVLVWGDGLVLGCVVPTRSAACIAWGDRHINIETFPLARSFESF